MSAKIFITGTDTDVGKTYVSVGLLHFFNSHGFSTLGIKPVASGCRQINGLLRNGDALQLQHASSVKLEYSIINPFAFELPIAPHIAADQNGIPLNVSILNQQLQRAMCYPSDICLIEGAGGWQVPLNAKETMADYVSANNLDVILVVGMRLGCLNHALLTHQAIARNNLRILGWIANYVDPEYKMPEENFQTLKEWLPSPCLAKIGYQSSVVKSLDETQLLKTLSLLSHHLR